jgi:hypothetical protein
MSIVFGTVNSARTVVVLLQKYIKSWISTSCKSVTIFMNCTFTNTSKANILAYVNNSFTFLKLAYYI